MSRLWSHGRLAHEGKPSLLPAVAQLLSLRAAMIPLIVLGPSLLGFLLVVLFCCLTRKWRWLAGAFIVGLFLHFLSAAIQSEPFFGEPSHEQFVEAHDFAVFYFWNGLPFFIAPFLLKFLYVFIRSHKTAT